MLCVIFGLHTKYCTRSKCRDEAVYFKSFFAMRTTIKVQRIFERNLLN
ncbi:hypothetical protein AG1IA_09969 [Rhizoctonia solani AG-1 IA]|uniref:Uncharacterized protein n=1 Tax=Thanatephorus cucumeris (strain AG1-IA) TaxID=983506 RepID=L8WCU6_THACA|nr:hypothetical protein AG1IA_09969 [Rhizoctonia solani AG-1 IA]